MRGYFSNILLVVLIICRLLMSEAFADKLEIGEVLVLEGKAELSSVVTGERFSIDEGKIILAGQKIRTGENTYLDLILHDGTRVYLRESTSISFYYLKRTETSPPTKMKIDFGKVRIIQKQRFKNKTLEVVTPTVIISVVAGDFSLIAARNEALVLVYGGRIGLVSSNPGVRQAFVGTRNEEIRIPANRPPSTPVIVPDSKMKKWLRDFVVVNRHGKIMRRERSQEIVDWILHERSY